MQLSSTLVCRSQKKFIPLGATKPIIAHSMSNKGLNRIKVVLVEQRKTGKWLAELLDKTDTTISKWWRMVTHGGEREPNEVFLSIGWEFRQ